MPDSDRGVTLPHDVRRRTRPIYAENPPGSAVQRVRVDRGGFYLPARMSRRPDRPSRAAQDVLAEDVLDVLLAVARRAARHGDLGRIDTSSIPSGTVVPSKSEPRPTCAAPTSRAAWSILTDDLPTTPWAAPPPARSSARLARARRTGSCAVVDRDHAALAAERADVVGHVARVAGDRAQRRVRRDQRRRLISSASQTSCRTRANVHEQRRAGSARARRPCRNR